MYKIVPQSIKTRLILASKSIRVSLEMAIPLSLHHSKVLKEHQITSKLSKRILTVKSSVEALMRLKLPVYTLLQMRASLNQPFQRKS